MLQFDQQAFEASLGTGKKPVYSCLSKVLFPYQGQVGVRSCGRCVNCVKVAKRDLTGRIASEVHLCQEVVILTLTYGRNPETKQHWPGAFRFMAEHRGAALEALRKQFRRDTIAKLEAERLQSVASVEGGHFGPPLWGDRPYKDKGMNGAQVALVKAKTPRFTYFGCGEKGAKKGRHHWHVVLFFDKPSGLPHSQTIPKKGGRRGQTEMERLHRPWWPWGHFTSDVATKKVTVMKPAFRNGPVVRVVEEMPLRKILKKALYSVKYITKARGITLRQRRMGIQPEAVFFRSTGRPLGSVWILDQARECARQGLPYNGEYFVPGMTNTLGQAPIAGWAKTQRGLAQLGLTPDQASVGNGAPRYTRYQVGGVTARQAAKAYRDAFQEKNPDGLMPNTDFMKIRDQLYTASEYCQPAFVPVEWLPRGEALPVSLPPFNDPKRAGIKMISVAGVVVGSIKVWPSGAAKLFFQDKRPVFLSRGDLWRELPMLDQKEREGVEAWLAKKRGPDWLTGVEYRAAERAILDRQQAAIEAFAKTEDETCLGGLEGFVPDSRLRRQLHIQERGYYRQARARMRMTVEQRSAERDEGQLRHIPMRGKTL